MIFTLKQENADMFVLLAYIPTNNKKNVNHVILNVLFVLVVLNQIVQIVIRNMCLIILPALHHVQPDRPSISIGFAKPQEVQASFFAKYP